MNLNCYTEPACGQTLQEEIVSRKQKSATFLRRLPIFGTPGEARTHCIPLRRTIEHLGTSKNYPFAF